MSVPRTQDGTSRGTNVSGGRLTGVVVGQRRKTMRKLMLAATAAAILRSRPSRLRRIPRRALRPVLRWRRRRCGSWRPSRGHYRWRDRRHGRRRSGRCRTLAARRAGNPRTEAGHAGTQLRDRAVRHHGLRGNPALSSNRRPKKKRRGGPRRFQSRMIRKDQNRRSTAWSACAESDRAVVESC